MACRTKQCCCCSLARRSWGRKKKKKKKKKAHLYKPEYIVQLAAGKWWRAPLGGISIAVSRVLNAPFRVPSRVIAVQHPGGDARQGQSEDNQRTEQLQHPPVVAREGGLAAAVCPGQKNS